MEFFVYILYCLTDTSYVGQTNHLVLRYYQHRDGKSRWTKRMRLPLVVHWEGFSTRKEAMKREKQLKTGQGFEERKRIIAQFVHHSDGGYSSVG